MSHNIVNCPICNAKNEFDGLFHLMLYNLGSMSIREMKPGSPEEGFYNSTMIACRNFINTMEEDTKTNM